MGVIAGMARSYGAMKDLLERRMGAIAGMACS
jgi:hypothetical protein